MTVRITPQQARALGISGTGRPKSKARERRPKSPGPIPFPSERLLALDPSSVAVGWAIFVRGELRSVGVFRSAIEDPRRRIAKLAEAAATLSLEGFRDIAIEIVSGQHRRARSLSVATCAFAQGAVWSAIARLHDSEPDDLLIPVAISCIKENEWTKGKPKVKRAELIRLTQPVYAEFARNDKDKGLDAADAVGLGLYYLGGCR